MVYTTLRERLGFSRTEIEGDTVRELLLKLSAGGPEDISGLLFEPGGAVKGHFVLTLNSRVLDNGGTGKAKVKSGDVLHIFPPISGG